MRDVSAVRFEVDGVVFAWDATKALANVRKHGVTFEEAATVFLDEHAQFRDESDTARGESRLIVVGWSRHDRLLLVVHVERGGAIRIISARRVTARERGMMERGDP